MTDTNDILPCPYCGSENIDESAARGCEGREGEIISAGCLDCVATGPDCYVPNSTGYEVSAKAWNNRHSQQAQGAAVLVCPLKDRECGDRPIGWCEKCPNVRPSAPASVPAEMQKDSERAKWHQGYEKAVADIADAVNEIMDGKAPEKTFGVSPLWAPTRERLIDFAKSHSAAAVPEGWKLVPVDPSLEMVVAGGGAIDMNGGEGGDDEMQSDAIHAYCAMLAAAPTPAEPGHIAGVNKKVEEESEENHG